MKNSILGLYVLFAGCVAIAACSQTADFSRFQYTPNLNAVPSNEAGSLNFRVLHNFGADRDGSRPNKLISVGDTFYGTTQGGGTNSCPYYGGCGTFFSINIDGKERVLHNFGYKKDGRNPVAGLIDVGGTLYGATNVGGAYGWGTIFSITPSGKERVLHNFGQKPDGEYPNGDLIDVGGMLYGTTFGGGIAQAPNCSSEGCGTVFSISTDGEYKVLHRFQSGADGWYPDAGLTDVGGTLYGTTFQGGLYGSYGNWGTLFTITRSGKLKVLHSFGKGNDGWYPAAALIDVEGTLYGTTQGGGTGFCGRGYGGCGTVFSISTFGKERMLHSFLGKDGSFPTASLIDVGGTLYGVTSNGGADICSHAYGRCGTVFSITTGGKEKVLHSFHKGAGGNAPATALTYKNGSLFGTTARGGAFGGGVIFSLTP
jgi:uncharacterized repeat protein (TIGR03803 family)